MPYSQTFESNQVGFHVKIAREKALEAAAAKLGVKESDLTFQGAEKPVKDGKTYTQKLFIIGK
jgi:hypothetical protein